MPFTVTDATALQREAADPSAPRMVNANAGSGKTKVLVDRVSRILLQDTDPDKILCLTYTRAAASEMQERLFEKFSEWSVLSDPALRAALSKLYGQPFLEIRPNLDLNRVRTLFARALETPEGLKVMTIHAFCERIIARFPIEAGLLPGFKPLDDSDERRLMGESRSRLLNAARSDATLSDAMRILTLNKADKTIDDLITRAIRDYERIRDWEHSGGLVPFLKASGLKRGQTPEMFAARAWAERDHDHLRRYAALCTEIGGWSAKFGDAIPKALAANDPAKAYHIYLNAFLTEKGKVTSQTASTKINKIDPFLAKDGDEVARISREADALKALHIAEISQAYLTVALHIGADYQRAKHATRGMDFQDLLVKTRDLLTRKEVSDWVAYKLDGGVEHVLLDEAQDTSPIQWDIVNAIADPFVQDSPDRDGPPRTFFAVGDPKQSIYRFQGAAPKLFMQSIRDRADHAKSITLRMSFRSAQAVLDVVDALYLDQSGLQSMFDPTTVPDVSDRVDHVAFREDPGAVELWPLVPRDEALQDKVAWDTTPVDATGDRDPKVRLARHIALTIKDWIAKDQLVFDRDLENPDGSKGVHRPIHAGDVLILVQKRVGGLFDAIIRELKRADLPVAGADRLVLQDAIIVRDLIAMTRFVLLPQDSLSLAEVLKSPLFGLDDHQLFTLCVDRGDQTLWQAVQDRAPETAEHLRAILSDADRPPYEFYTRLLDRAGPDGPSFREALFARLGRESAEALNAFLALALAHQQRRAPSLQRFLQAFMADTIEIKRDQDPAGREVRVMTVHGAKGLEAPIVFLPDTTRAPRKTSGGLIEAGETYILEPSERDSTDLTDTYKLANREEQMREYMRLLYVAMTRAESRLILCGAWHGSGKTGYEAGAWYDWFAQTMDGLETTTLDNPFDETGPMGRMYGQPVPSSHVQPVGETADLAALPDWINQPIKPERSRQQQASPSALLARAEPLGRGPGEPRFLRGILIHKLLEILPDHPVAARSALARKMLVEYSELTDAQRDQIVREVFSVLDHPDFSIVFAEGSQAEVSFAGRVSTIRNGEVYLTAQVDRLNVTETCIYLVDYKSNRPSPDKIEGVDPTYLAQMAAYRELARAIWPGRAVKCGLLWTETPHMMWLHDNAMDVALTQVNTLPTSET